MTPTDYLRAIVAPVVELSLLLPLLLFWATFGFAAWALTQLGPGATIGAILIFFLSLPPLFRFQAHIVRSYANGRAPDALDAEYFSWIGNLWSLFPLLLAIGIGVASYQATAAWGVTGTWVVFIVAVAVWPASLAVLVITHSVLQAVNPIALFNIYERAGASFLVAPAYILALSLIIAELAPLPVWAAIGIALFMMFSVASLTGSLIAPSRLTEDVYIPEALEPDQRQISGDLQKLREATLAHAYGFVSRDNREGGFTHLFDAIAEDPDPVGAWDWYLKSMFQWEDSVHALFFAQRYIHDALAHGEDVRALKVILRCQHENERFRPLREDVPGLIAAAERSGNTELAEVLRRG